MFLHYNIRFLREVVKMVKFCFAVLDPVENFDGWNILLSISIIILSSKLFDYEPIVLYLKKTK